MSPVTAALCASEPLPPWWPSSMYFLALSHAPPPVVIEIATNRPVTIVPISTPPSAFGPEQQADDDRHRDRQQRRHDHFLDRRLGQHVHGLVVLRLAGAFHDPGDLAELAAHFLHHRARRAADRFHRHRAEQVGDQAADQQADDHHVVGQVEAQRSNGHAARQPWPHRRCRGCACSRRTAPARPAPPNRSHSPWSPPWWCCRRRRADR